MKSINLYLIIIIVTVARAEETVEADEREEEEVPSLVDILGEKAPVVANTRTAITYGILGRHFANEGTISNRQIRLVISNL